jgi:hypothetical protein
MTTSLNHPKEPAEVPAWEAGSHVVNHVRYFQDENTGRKIRQLTNLPKGVLLEYFRFYKLCPDGRMLIRSQHDYGNALLLDPVSGDLELLPWSFYPLKMRESDGRVWFLRYPPNLGPDGRPPRPHELWHIDLPNGSPVKDADLPDFRPLRIEDITIDGAYLILREANQDLDKYPIPTVKNPNVINHYFSRPRHGSLIAYHLASAQQTLLFTTQGLCPLHVDTSPVDPGLIRYCRDMPDALGQRIWTVRIDGSDHHPIRLQEYGEMTTHEFWWADGRHIGYTYQDRRQDPNLEIHHWAEYSPATTHLGIADLAGREVYRSDPLNSYHVHLYRSNDSRFVSGEGTDGNSFVRAARFDWNSTRLDMVPLATIHTPYIPFRGQKVECNFSADSRRLIYTDRPIPSQPFQLFDVEVDLD